MTSEEEIKIDELWDKYYDLQDEINKYERWIENTEDELNAVKEELRSLGEPV
ncbi:conjugal transfer protein TraF [Paenibacillus xylanexedens]|uniref:conjugal transfer protein TraF n=1 Tax=Paenibacillus xylanexedens TaxID=528191 RepID=UPI0011A7C65E|nr:conjugal transfer protein TraF [Paenibacillus xylanexedens]